MDVKLEYLIAMNHYLGHKVWSNGKKILHSDRDKLQ